MTTGVKIGIIVGAAVLVTVVIVVVVKSKNTQSVNLGIGTTGISANPQVNALVAYNAPNMGNNWAMVLPTLTPTDLNTLYTYISQKLSGQNPPNFQDASNVVHKYKLSTAGTYFS